MKTALAVEPPDDHVERLRRDVVQQRSRLKRLLQILRLERLPAP